MLFLAICLLSCATAQDISLSIGDPTDPPKIFVDPALLQRFGVIKNVNQPGLFKKILTIPFNSDLAHTQMVLNQARILVQNFMHKSAINYSREYVQIYSDISEGDGAQLVAAHFVNIVYRFLNLLSDHEGLAIRSLESLLEVMNKHPDQVNILCRTNQLISIPATLITREIDPVKSCSKITTMAKNGGADAVNLKNQFKGIQTETEAALKALNTVGSMILDTSVPIQAISNFVTEHSILPESYKSLLIPLVTQSFYDYAEWVTNINAQEARQLSNFFAGMKISEVRGFVIQAAFNLIRASSK